jgi:hypothetical protein
MNPKENNLMTWMHDLRFAISVMIKSQRGRKNVTNNSACHLDKRFNFKSVSPIPRTKSFSPVISSPPVYFGFLDIV